MIPEALLAHLASVGWQHINLTAIICGMPISASLKTGSERFARQQQAFARLLPPDHVPDPVLLTVLSWPFYGVTPSRLRSNFVATDLPGMEDRDQQLRYPGNVG